MRNLARNVLRCGVFCFWVFLGVDFFGFFCKVAKSLASTPARQEREGIAELNHDLNFPLYMRFLCSQKSGLPCAFSGYSTDLGWEGVFKLCCIFLKDTSVVSS